MAWDGGRWLLSVWAALACGCGSTAADPYKHPDLVQTFEVAQGTCGISRKITLLHSDVGRIVRSTAGFVAAETNRMPVHGSWHLVSDDGVSQWGTSFYWYQADSLTDSWTDSILAGFPFYHPPGDLDPVLLTTVGVQSEGRLSARPFTPPGSVRELGAYFVRGTTNSASSSSLDGNRVLFAADHAGAFPPHAVLFDSEGTLLGSELVLDHGNFTCLTTTPTTGSAALSVLYDGAAPVLRLLEFAADGAVVINASIAVSSSTCPLLQSDGPSVGSVVTAVVVDDAVQIYAFVSGTPTALISTPPPLAELGSVPLWLARRTDGSLSLLVLKDSRLQLAQVTANGDVTWIPAELPVGNVIPSAPGELFLDVPGTDPVRPDRGIVQVTCNGVGFAPLP